jgi:hypothetical protein
MCMEKTPTREADSLSLCRGSSCRLCNPEVHHLIKRGSCWFLYWAHFNPVHTDHSYRSNCSFCIARYFQASLPFRASASALETTDMCMCMYIYIYNIGHLIIIPLMAISTFQSVHCVVLLKFTVFLSTYPLSPKFTLLDSVQRDVYSFGCYEFCVSREKIKTFFKWLCNLLVPKSIHREQ